MNNNYIQKQIRSFPYLNKKTKKKNIRKLFHHSTSIRRSQTSHITVPKPALEDCYAEEKTEVCCLPSPLASPPTQIWPHSQRQPVGITSLIVDEVEPAEQLWQTGYDWSIARRVVIELKQGSGHQLVVLGNSKQSFLLQLN